ncbi:MAG: phosphoserine phosphatase SerB [Rhodobacteraceae bacterium]|nr:MAG: phosphoserine phosphatase SerB [Paracoccaceae bacterium]
MTTTLCFVTRNLSVTSTDVKKVEIEFEKNNLEVIEKTRLGVDGVVLRVKNLVFNDFTYLEQALKLDINFSSKAIKLKKLLLADMDSTIISCECIDELAEYAGVRHEVAAITEKAMAGNIDFVEALRQRVRLLKGLTIQQLNDCYDKKILVNKGAMTLVKTMGSLGSSSAIVSGGFSFFAEKVAREIGFDHVYANQLVFEGNMLSGAVKNPIMGSWQKQMVLHKLCNERNIEQCDVIAVGDGANDIDIVRNAGTGVSYYGKPKLSAISDFKVNYSDLRALLYFQGIRESEFSTE